MQLRSISKKEQVSRWREIIEIRKKCYEEECCCKYKRTCLYCYKTTDFGRHILAAGSAEVEVSSADM